MKYINKKTSQDFSSFFFYMWNAWSKQECDLVFGNMSEHFWNKWCQACNPDVFGAAERFYKELSENNRDLLVNRAVTIYNGFHKIQESEIWVCSVCGSEVKYKIFQYRRKKRQLWMGFSGLRTEA